MVTPNPLNIPYKVFFWYPLSPLLLSPMCKCDLSLSNVYLTLYVYVYVYVFVLPNCHVFFYWFLLFYVVCLFPCSMSLDGWLWPSVACSLSCLSLNIARQSTGPWASRSTKVMLTHSLPIMTPPPFSLSFPPSLLHVPKPTRRTNHPRPHCVHSMVQPRVECGRHPLMRGFKFSRSLNFRTHKSFKRPSFISVYSRSSVFWWTKGYLNLYVFMQTLLHDHFDAVLVGVLWCLWLLEHCCCFLFFCCSRQRHKGLRWQQLIGSRKSISD